MRKILFFIALICLGCKSEYTKDVEAGLDSGIIHDGLIFGLKMGMPKQAFYDRCTQLNKDKLIDQGEGKFAKFIMPLDTVHNEEAIYRKEMQFHPILDKQNSIIGMEMRFNYSAWSPWNTKLQTQTLVNDLEKMFLKDFPGNNFKDIKIENIDAKVKIDGNRQIIIYAIDSKNAKVKIEDLRQKYKKHE